MPRRWPASTALTGWALDNIGVKQVELGRDLQQGRRRRPGNTTKGDPGTAGISLRMPRLSTRARPDVEALNPTIPMNYRAGWGYLI